MANKKSNKREELSTKANKRAKSKETTIFPS